MIEYGSVCSGIEAASVAWHGLGWRPRWFAEIDAFPSAVLAHRWTFVPNLGDFTKIRGDDESALDLLVGGTPCQSFSVAGLRGGLDDERGQLALEYLRLARRVRARWVVWENVPGVLSSDGGRDFGAFLGGLVELGYGFAFRVLDAQFFGVPQRRRRVFVVGYLGDWRPAAAVLSERASLRGDPPPSRTPGQDVAGPLGSCAGDGGFRTTDLDGSGAFVAANAEGSTGLPFLTRSNIGKILNNQTPLVVVPFDTTQLTHPENRSNPQPGDPAAPLASTGHPPTIAFTSDGINADPISAVESRTYTHEGANNFRMHNVVRQQSNIRRLTPRECERLQGFPDDYTLIPWRNGIAADGPRYKALGNSMAVPVMRWIGERIAFVEGLIRNRITNEPGKFAGREEAA